MVYTARELGYEKGVCTMSQPMVIAITANVAIAAFHLFSLVPLRMIPVDTSKTY
jgi:hypothetical protein